MKRCPKLAAMLAGVLLCVGSAFGAVSGIASGGIVFMSGGVGETERQEMTARESEFDLTVWAALKGSCAFVVPDWIWVNDDQGVRVFEVAPEGPLTYLHVGPGRYTVGASFRGVIETRRVTISAVGRRNVYFYWSSAEDVGPARSNAR